MVFLYVNEVFLPLTLWKEKTFELVQKKEHFLTSESQQDYILVF